MSRFVAGSRPPSLGKAPVLPPGVVLEGNPARRLRLVWKYTRPNRLRRLLEIASPDERPALICFLSKLAWGR